MKKTEGITRRRFLNGAGLAAAGLSMPMVWTGTRAFAADQITVADVGGAPGAAIKQAFYDPFEKETGIHVVGVAHEADPQSQFKLLVDTGSFIWDACMVTPSHVAYLSKPKDYLEPLGISAEDGKDFVPGTLTPVWLGFSVYGMIMAYRTDKFGENGPKTWADFFDVAKFPGRRGLYKGYQGAIEMALLADGVAPDKLYPLDLDRAFKKLDTIKSDIVWWGGGAQSQQLLASGEAPIGMFWNGRIFAIQADNPDVGLSWDQNLTAADVLVVPKGAKNKDAAMKFLAEASSAKAQADMAKETNYAPTNLKSKDLLDPGIASFLPDQFKATQINLDMGYWAEHRDEIGKRWYDWQAK